MADFPQLPGNGTLRWGGQAPTLLFGPLRVTQQVVKVLHVSDADLRVTQQVVKALHAPPADLRTTRQVVKVLWGPSPDLRITQQVVKVLYQTPSHFYDCGLPPLTPDDLCNKRNVLAWVEWDVDGSTTLTYEA